MRIEGQSKMINVDGPWISPYDGNKVKVSLHDDGNGVFRIAVWGSDDYGYEKNYKSAMDAKVEYKNLVKCSKNILEAMGFSRA